MSDSKAEPPDSVDKPDRWFAKRKPWSFSSPGPSKDAEDCLPSNALDHLREKVIGRPLSDDVAEIISYARTIFISRTH